MALPRNRPHFLLSLIFLVWASLFILRWQAPSDLLDKDQERPAAYMLDAALNNHWVIQVDDHGRVCSKPPVYTWIGAGLILAFGRITDFALYFPSALGVLGCCLVMWWSGGATFGRQAVFIGALTLMLSPIGIRILYLARTDALFGFTTFLTACIGFRCWQQGKGWVWFWLCATLSTLTKGPLGLALAAGGLLAVVWERGRIFKPSRLLANHGIGIVLYLGISIGWMVWAYLLVGDAAVDRLLGKELYGHANWASGKYEPGPFFLIMPTLYFLSRFFPWSLLAFVGLRRSWRRPAAVGDQRRFERFLCAYLGAGILLFSLVPHQRPDHLFPLLPAAGLLAGREVWRWLSGRHRQAMMLPAAAGVWCLFLIGYGLYYYQIDPATNPYFARTAGVRQLARDYAQRFGDGQRLVFVDVPFGLQYYLNRMQRRLSHAQAARLLQGEGRVMAAVRDVDRLRQHLPQDFRLYPVMRWPASDEALVRIVSNQPVDASGAGYGMDGSR